MNYNSVQTREIMNGKESAKYSTEASRGKTAAQIARAVNWLLNESQKRGKWVPRQEAADCHHKIRLHAEQQFPRPLMLS